MRTAEFWHKLEGERIECMLCPHHCKLREGQTGLCRVRTVKDGALQAMGYGQVSSAHVDPIEKKPLYHFYPGTEIFSIGGWGCNFACTFCQNWSISQEVHWADAPYTPEQVVARAIQSSCPSIAYTYNEPLIGFEFVEECAALAEEAGLANVLVTNGYIEPAPAARLLPLIRALNVDIKSSAEDFYREQCHARLAPVLAFCEQAVQAGCHIEITNLLIPTLNDRPEEIAILARWVRDHLGPHTPLHLSAYRPEYKLKAPPTPPALLEQAYDICRKDLTYVYLGNVLTERGQSTQCPQCSHELIRRWGYQTAVTGITQGACAHCGRKADVLTAR